MAEANRPQVMVGRAGRPTIRYVSFRFHPSVEAYEYATLQLLGMPGKFQRSAPAAD